MFARKVLLFITLLSFGLSAYAGEKVSVSGKWVGVNYTSQVEGPAKVVVNLSQNGNKITGDYWASTGVAGKGAGKMTSDTTFHMDWVNTTSSCPGTYSNDYTIKGDQITWVFTGKDCLGKEEGHGYARRSK